MGNKEKKTESQAFMKIAFVFIGIGSLLSWNAILSCFDFFMFFQQGYKPQVIFPNMNFVLNLFFQFFLLKYKKIATYKSQIIFAFLVTSVILALLPFVVIYLDATKSFYTSCGLMLLSGLANAVCSSAIFGLASYLPVFEFLGTGQGIAGIICNSLRYVLLFIFSSAKEEDFAPNLKKSAYIFFGTAAFIIIIVICFVIGLYKNECFYEFMKDTDEFPKENVGNEEQSEQLQDGSINDVETATTNTTPVKEFSVMELVSKLANIYGMLLLTYIVTFTLFPGVSIKPSLFELSIGWKINTIIFIFNVSDTFSRNFSKCFSVPTTDEERVQSNKAKKITLNVIVLGRLLLLGTFIGVYAAEKYKLLDSLYLNIIVIVNTMLLAMTSGFATTLSFGLATDSVENENKGKAGSFASLSLISGIFLGTFGGIAMDTIITF